MGAANSSHLLRMGRLIALHSTWQERPRGGSEHSTHAKAFLVPSRTERHESRTPVEGTSLTLSFYVLLAPIFLWLGFTFLAVRVVLTMLSRRAERGRSKPLPTCGNGKRCALSAAVLSPRSASWRRIEK